LSNFLYSELALSLWKATPNSSAIDEPPGSIDNIDTENEFALEKHLEDFLVANWESTELGKKYDLIEEDGDLVSQQYPTKIGRIDLLVKEKKTGSYVVIELKKGQTNDDTVGQLARYLGWIKEKMGTQSVKGIVIARLEDEKLKYALKAIPNVEFFVYKVNFALEKR
jgi:restriction system protein